MKYQAQIQELTDEMLRYKRGWGGFTFSILWRAMGEGVEKCVGERKRGREMEGK